MPNQKHHFQLFAKYNADMNATLCERLAELPVKEHFKDRNAFFGSIFGTLNHIMVGDLIWLNRFRSFEREFVSLTKLSDLPLTSFPPSRLDQVLFKDAKAYTLARDMLDGIIKDVIQETNVSDYAKTLTYTNTKGIAHTKNFGLLLTHLFNHQTHHRGQVSTLFSQLGIDIGATDFLVWMD